MADEPEIILDVAGQPGGPHPDIQATVDAEQRELIDRIKAERAPAEAEEARRLDARMKAAQDAASERRSFESRLKAVEARLTALEASR